MLTDHELVTLAGKPAFARGRAYHADARIALSRHDPDGLEGEARGSEHYALWLERDGSRWRWDCACPAADGGAFCKHLVAAVLSARGDPPETASAPTTRRAKRGDELADFLRAQSQERLAGWLLAFADEDPNIAKRLRLHRAADDPALLKSALGKMLDASGFLDYRRSLDYARRLDAVVEQLKGAVARDAAAGRALCEYALGRLLRIYARSDDSAGGIGDQLQRCPNCMRTRATLRRRARRLPRRCLPCRRKTSGACFPWMRIGMRLARTGKPTKADGPSRSSRSCRRRRPQASAAASISEPCVGSRRSRASPAISTCCSACCAGTWSSRTTTCAYSSRCSSSAARAKRWRGPSRR